MIYDSCYHALAMVGAAVVAIGTAWAICELIERWRK